jgi:uncharacterized protein YkwD
MKNLITLLITLLSLNGTSQLPTDTIGYDGINVRLLDSLVEVYVNEERINYGVKPLEISEGVRNHSYTHSQWMVDNDKYEHSKGSITVECILTTLIYGGLTYEVASKRIVGKWFDSLPHKRSLLGGYYKYGGCGTAFIKDSDDSFYLIKSSFGLSPISSEYFTSK